MRRVFSEEQLDCLQELINVAMGLASNKLARFLSTFVYLQVPSIALVSSAQVSPQFDNQYSGVDSALVSQGFLGNDGLTGEAIVLYQLDNAHRIATLLGYETDSASELEMLTDISSILITTFLNSLAEQIDNSLSYSAPRVLSSRQENVAEALLDTVCHWDLALKVDISYQLIDHSFNCDMLLLILGEAVLTIQQILVRILEEC